MVVGDHADVPPEFLHAALCQMGLPRSPTSGRSFERTNGNGSLLLQAGQVWTGNKWREAALPYGVKPRLVLIYACSEAVRNQSPVIDLGDSVKEFLNRLDLDTSGRGYALFRNQMEALAACNMTIGISTPARDITISTRPVDRYEAWYTNDGQQEVMWPGLMELSPKFYETLTEHAVPLDPRAIGALKSSALALDIYTFLANRLCRVRKQDGVKLSWQNLRSQFGQEYGVSKDFKKAYKRALKRVLLVYPSAKVTEEIGGLRLYPSPPPIKKTKVINLKNRDIQEVQKELDL